MRSYSKFLISLFTILVSFHASAQNYPSKTVRIIVPYAPGGPIDVAARVVGQKLQEMWGQPVVVDNRAGAGGIIGTEAVARAAPDGYTLLMGTFNELAINPALFSKLPYDPEHSFAPIALVSQNPMVLASNPKAKISSPKELIAAAEASKEPIAWASPGLGTSNHIVGEWFAGEAGIKTLHIPYKGAPAALNSTLTGETAYGIFSLVSALPFIKAGTLQLIAVSTEKRSPLAPDWPTLSESGIPVDLSVRAALFAPAGTPKALITKINTDVVRILQSPDTRERFASLGVEPVGSTPEQLDAAIKTATTQIGKVVKRAQIKVE
jgi:tripartite-type tricarboxylate transporter receptor subunit TctC